MSGRVALVVATLIALFGPLLVLGAFDSAGGGERPRPHAGLLEPGVACLDDERDYRRETVVPAPSCPDLPPAGLRAEYRTAWIGLALGLFGAALVVLLVSLRSTPRVAYGALAAIAGMQFIAAAGIALASFDLEITSGGSEPQPRDAFDRIARWLFVVSLALVPLGALARRLPTAARGGAAPSAN